MLEEENDLTLKFTNIVRGNGITDQVFEVLIQEAGLQGEGFASKTYWVTVKFENSNVKPLNLFVKEVSQCESHIEMLNDIKAFAKEARFLTEYVPAAERLWTAKGCQGPLDLYPKCYFGDKRMIVLENLVLDKGYCLLSKAERQDLEAAKFALTTLAKHHAVSYAMIQEEGGAHKFFTRFPDLDFEAYKTPHYSKIMGPMFANALSFNIGILENNNVDGRDDALTVLKSFKNVPVIDSIIQRLKCDEDDLMVLNHGDYWNNNMMFLKDKMINKIIGHKAIDLQITRYNTPTFDLAYYFFNSVQIDVRIAHLEELLQLYLDILKKVAQDLGYQINLTYEQLFLQLRRRIDFGFWSAMCMVFGPGLEAIMKDFDINAVHVEDWASWWKRGMDKWMVENPEYSKVIAIELVKLAEEYKSLSVK